VISVLLTSRPHSRPNVPHTTCASFFFFFFLVFFFFRQQSSRPSTCILSRRTHAPPFLRSARSASHPNSLHRPAPSDSVRVQPQGSAVQSDRRPPAAQRPARCRRSPKSRSAQVHRAGRHPPSPSMGVRAPVATAPSSFADRPRCPCRVRAQAGELRQCGRLRGEGSADRHAPAGCSRPGTAAAAPRTDRGRQRTPTAAPRVRWGSH